MATRKPRAKTTKSSSTSTKARTAPKGTYTPRLTRSSTSRVIAGVAGGMGEYFGVDPVVLRILFVLFTLFGGSGVLLYIVLWLIIPSRAAADMNPNDAVQENAREMRETAKSAVATSKSGSARHTIAILLIILGGWWLLSNLGLFRILHLSRMWPILLVALGISLLSTRKSK